MEAKVKVVSVSLTHDDLVSLFSTALYGNDILEGSYCKSDYPNINFEETDCFEDIIAKILLNGGEITITDNEGAESNAKDICYYGKKSKNWQSTGIVEGYGWSGKYYAPTYKINLQNILNGIKSPEGYKLAEELLINEEGDFYTAFNLLQIIVFGEEIYG